MPADVRHKNLMLHCRRPVGRGYTQSMTLFYDHVLLTAIIASAVGLYAVEMLFFWSRWQRLALQMHQEGGAHTLIQELQAEVDVLAEEVAGLRRQLTRYGEVSGIPEFVASGARMESAAPKRSIATSAAPAPRPSPSASANERKQQSSQGKRPEERDMPPRSHSVPQSSALGNGFSRGVEMLHRRVVELARSGLDSASIATECQLSQTEAELILSLNGIKRN